MFSSLFKRRKLWPLWIMALLATPCPVRGQETTGTIFGVVKDASGAVLTGVDVRAVNELTNSERRTLTGNQGDYIIPRLPVGRYRVRAVRAGFKSFTQEGIHLQVNQRARLDITLPVGPIQETITTVADVSQVETASSGLGQVVDHQKIVDLPLNGRNFTQLGLLLPGVVAISPEMAQAGIGVAEANAFSVNGQRTQSNVFYIDGSENNNLERAGYVIKPPPDALQEFRILTSNASAEFGRNAGGVVNILTRSGTNALRGTFWEFLRNDILDARGFFAAQKEAFHRHQFGFILGGPVIPERTFFFGYYEGLRNRQGVTKGTNVPSLLERAGNFSASGRTIIDPLTGDRRQPFPGNVIPPDRIDPIASALLQYYPRPQSGNRFTASPAGRKDEDQFGLRLDHQVNADHRLYGRYLFINGKGVSPFSPLGSDIPGFPDGQSERGQSALIHWMRIFSPHLIHEFHGSYFRHHVVLSDPLTKIARETLGFRFPSAIPALDNMPQVQISGFSAVGPTNQGPSISTRNVFQFADHLSYTRGRHLLKFGAEIVRYQINNLQANFVNGQFTFTGTFTGYALADFLLGLPASSRQAGGQRDRYLRYSAFRFYTQDEFKLASNFTLNLGGRYELVTPFQEKYGRLAGFRGDRFQQNGVSARFPTAPPGLIFPGDPGVPGGVTPTDRLNLAPRVGFAWAPFQDSKTSLRGAFGLFYDTIIANAVTPTNPPPFYSSLILTPPRSLADPYQGRENPFLTPGLRFALPVSYNFLIAEQTLPYAMQWNLSIQREFARDYLLEIGYVGTRGLHQPRVVDLNPARYIPGASSPANTDARRIYAPYYAAINEGATEANSSYHALQASLNKRLGQGLSFLASYTLSKNIDDYSFWNCSSTLFCGESTFAQNPSNRRLERGLSLLDQTHLFVFNGIYELPFYKQQAGWVGHMLGGWQVGGIAMLRSGHPFTVTEPLDIALTGSPQRPDLLADPNRGRPGTVEQFFNTNAFRRLDPRADAGRFGTAGRNIVRAPSFKNLDFAIFKNFRVRERHMLQFRTEFFNVFNHPNFQIPVANIGSPSFGRILNAYDPRIIQLALKYSF